MCKGVRIHLRIVQAGVSNGYCDPAIGGVIDPIRRIEVIQDEWMRVIVLEDGARSPPAGQHPKAAFFVSVRLAEVDVVGLLAGASEFSS